MKKGDAATELWDWFSGNSGDIALRYGAQDYAWLDQELSPRVSAIAEEMNWEIGPYALPNNAFVLSPAVRANLVKARTAVTLAPTIPGWAFLPAKPAKDLSSLIFSVGDVTVSADDWRYRITSYNRGEFVDIEIFFESSIAPPTSSAGMFCELVVEALLGEELRLDRVGYVTHAVVDDVAAIEKVTRMKYLRKHLETVLSPFT